jgi:membrane-bound lytic murein transglycosylase F
LNKYTKKRRNRTLQDRLIVIISVCFLGMLIVGILLEIRLLSSLNTIQKRGKLVVITTNTSSTYYYGSEGPKGMEYELATLFAQRLGVPVEFRIKHNINEVLEAIKKGEGDIAAAGMSKTPERKKNYLFGPPYYEVTQYVVGKRFKNLPRTIEDLPAFRPLIVSGTSFEENLIRLKHEYPALEWDTTTVLSTEQILEKIWLGDVDVTICDDKIISLYRRYFPELFPLFPVSDPEPVAWILRDNSYDLKRSCNKWFRELEKSGYLDELVAKYFGYYEIFDYFDIRTFHWRIETRLPLYRKWFEEAGKLYNIPWTLLAAQSYQESHWISRAKSPTGVRGLMMLTLSTARMMSVTNRLDPKQSIFGGARYLAGLIERIPSTVQPNDRYLFALAAYNVGFGHLSDARNLAVELGKNPNSWHDLKTVLPLLSQSKYYSKLPFGYARGMEPVRYVDRIVNYRDILERSVYDDEDLKPDTTKTNTTGPVRGS